MLIISYGKGLWRQVSHNVDDACPSFIVMEHIAIQYLYRLQIFDHSRTKQYIFLVWRVRDRYQFVCLWSEILLAEDKTTEGFKSP